MNAMLRSPFLKEPVARRGLSRRNSQSLPLARFGPPPIPRSRLRLAVQGQRNSLQGARELQR